MGANSRGGLLKTFCSRVGANSRGGLFEGGPIRGFTVFGSGLCLHGVLEGGEPVCYSIKEISSQH